VAVDDLDGLVEAARVEGVGLVAIGPEAPLCAGLADRFRREGVPVFGPGLEGAELEGSKAFAKEVMSRGGIPTAGYRVFEERDQAVAHLEGEVAYPVVVKASGLAAGKGALICPDRDAAVAAVDAMMVERRFGAAGDRVVVEDCLSGPEVSVHCVTDGRTFLTLPTSQDHKRALDGDKGPNTGGMGAVSPAPVLPPKAIPGIEREILLPTIHALRATGRSYRGVLYAGLMMTRTGPKVLEYNARFGDPETQAILPRLRGDLAEILLACAEGQLDRVSDDAFDWDPRPAITVVVAAGGYPGKVHRGDAIEGLDAVGEMDDVFLFHAGTARVAGRTVTSGGRVLAVTALGDTAAAAQARAYDAVARIRFSKMQFRRDIGWQAVAAEEGGNG
jgi:phosphoribosylamine--glycine ligase